MQKWEYCAVGPIDTGFTRETTQTFPGGRFGEAAARLPGLAYRATLVSMTSKGLTRPQSIDSPEDLARTIAALGENGWELVGCGTVGDTVFDRIRVEHFLYFKRPKE